ncbi:MAG: G-D-S-L family lipolytic protein [Rhodobacteraceae bacterium]|nr:G-D-S-L family lipolytic protein [Paracoccaceae bacterium]
MGAFASVLSWLALPLYAVEGTRVRARIHRHPPPPGPVSGRVGAEAGDPLRLLVLGDSSAAAVGLKRQEDGLAPCLAEALSEQAGRPVEWRSAGFNSATAGMLRDHVVHNLEPVPYTHVLLSVGFNDMKNYHSRRRFLREFGGLIYAVKARFPESRLYWSRMLDPADVPGLPPHLAAILRLRVSVLDPTGACLCRERGARAIPAMRGLVPEAFCDDGIHPSEAGFRGWAAHLAAHMHADR